MEFVNGKGDIPYMKWKIKMCATTNQLFSLVNQLFLWPFSIANCNKLPEGKLKGKHKSQMDVTLGKTSPGAMNGRGLGA